MSDGNYMGVLLLDGFTDKKVDRDGFGHYCVSMRGETGFLSIHGTQESMRSLHEAIGNLLTMNGPK